MRTGTRYAALYVIVALAMTAATSGSRPVAPETARGARQTSIVLLGTGSPVPDPDASGPATAIVVDKKLFMVDAGAGVMRRLAAAQLPGANITALFLTHLHSDHTLGYPDVIFTSWIMGRRTPLAVYGPRGLQRMTAHIRKAWSEDIRVRIQGLEREPQAGSRVSIHEIRPGTVYEQDGVRVTAIPVLHGTWKEAYGFRFDTATRSITISGDTRPCEALVKAAQGTEVLIHEVYPQKSATPEDRSGGDLWPQYLREFHTSARELGALAARINPRLLILYHVVGKVSDEELVNEVRTGGFNGRIVVGKDLQRY